MRGSIIRRSDRIIFISIMLLTATILTVILLGARITGAFVVDNNNNNNYVIRPLSSAASPSVLISNHRSQERHHQQPPPQPPSSSAPHRTSLALFSANRNSIIINNDRIIDNEQQHGTVTTVAKIKATCNNNNNDNKPNLHHHHSHNQQHQKQQQQLFGFAVTTAIVLSCSCMTPLPAHAGFGPSGGATTTEPSNLKSIETTASKVKKATTPATTKTTTSATTAYSTSTSFDLDGKKLKTLIGSSLNDKRLDEFSNQLDTIIDNLRDSVASFGDALTTGTEEDEKNSDTTTKIITPAGGEEEKERSSTSLKYLEQQENLTPEQEQALAVQRQEQQDDNDKRLSGLLEKLVNAEKLKEQIQQQELILQKLQQQPYWFNYCAAFIGSAISTCIMHPLDTIKTRLQIASSSSSSSSASASGTTNIEDTTATTTNSDGRRQLLTVNNGSNSTATMTTTTAAAAATMTNDNSNDNNDVDPNNNNNNNLYDNLYEGLTGNLFKEGPPSAVYLGVYETVKYALSPTVPPEYLLWVYLLAGAAGETVGSVIRAPAEAVKSLVQSKAKANAIEAVQAVFATDESRTNVVRAWSASVGRDVPFGAIQLAVFELIKTYILNNPNIDIDSSTLLAEACIGAFAGGLGAFVTNPADVITTRIITQDVGGSSSSDDSDDDAAGRGSIPNGINGHAKSLLEQSAILTPTNTVTAVSTSTNNNTATTTTNEESRRSNGSSRPLGVVEMGQQIYSEGGISAFFKGWEARVGYWAPAISIFLSCYCSVRQAGIKYDLFS